MAEPREPPPLFDEENEQNKDEDDDLFAPAVTDSPETKQEVNEKTEETVAEVEPVNLLDGGGEEVSLDSPAQEAGKEEPAGAANIGTEPVDPVQQKATTVKAPASTNGKMKYRSPKDEIEKEDSEDLFIVIKVSQPQKVGDGIGSYVTYKMDEADEWFEEKQQQLENLDNQLRKLHASVEALLHHRKQLSVQVPDTGDTRGRKRWGRLLEPTRTGRERSERIRTGTG
ncbi:PREDICTED: sorting nexin-2-like [Priapulus caudatus]|uniref:Sorting nexin-2-like n=1 Tax=Priapulus caudatus TaxID=37621 RepID=A0ABM1F9G1_PRICU|nr:PREDICTED: sorting nexin-2-like [Priapulus caudatus]